MSKPLVITLSMPEAEQLRSYVRNAEADGWYYGPEKAFRIRHERIKKALFMEDK